MVMAALEIPRRNGFSAVANVQLRRSGSAGVSREWLHEHNIWRRAENQFGTGVAVAAERANDLSELDICAAWNAGARERARGRAGGTTEQASPGNSEMQLM